MLASLPLPLSLSRRRSIAFVEATREQSYEFDSSVFPLHLAVMFRTVFLTELWRVSVMPLTQEKELWVNHNASGNNEAIELQMQMLPLSFLPRETQDAMLRAYEPALTAEALSAAHPVVGQAAAQPTSAGGTTPAFLKAWVDRMHAWCENKQVVVRARNAHSLFKLAVTTEDATVRDALSGEEIPEDTQIVFPGFQMPFSDARVRFPLVCYLEPTVAQCGTATQTSELALRSRFFVVRARDNACFNVVSDAFFLCKEQYEDCAAHAPETYRAAEQTLLRAQNDGDGAPGDDAHAPRGTTTLFKLRQVTDMYSFPFCWFAATNVLLARLQVIVAKFESGEFRFAPSAEVMGGAAAGPVYEWILRAGQLSAPWETEFMASRQATFETTGGLPLAFEKREVAEGYAELEYARFVSEQVLQTCYGRTVSRVTCFERFDQDQMIVRVQPLTPTALPSGNDVGRLFVHAAQECAQRLVTFYRTYRQTF